MTASLLLEKIEKLPVNFQQEIEDFVDFLYAKFINQEKISEDEKKILNEQYKDYLQNPTQ